MNSCACGCGAPVSRQYVSGHNLIGQVKTEKHRRNLAEGARRAWRTKRQQMPLGSTRLNARGYVVVKVAIGGGRWIPQHTLVMQEMAGRPLTPGEAVHHINGVRDDNRPDNLYLCRDNRHHMEIENSMAVAFRELMAAGLARFNKETGRYEGVLRR